jgi:hypothetical protein
MVRRAFILLVIFRSITANGFAQELTDKEVRNSINYFDQLEQEQYKVSVRAVPSQVVESLKKQDAYWYADYAPAPKKQATSIRSPVFSKNWFRSLLWLLILTGFISVVIWYLFSGKLSFFRRGAKLVESRTNQEAAPDIFSLDYERQLNAACNDGNFSQAVRLLYWQTLKSLHEKELIRYASDRTNYSYIQSLQGSRYFNDFVRLTRQFEYTWYGKFPLSSAQFEAVQHEFSSFKTALH